MSDDAFSQPLRGDKFEGDAFDGALLLFYPTDYFSSIPTQHGETAVVDTHIVALDRPDLTGQPTVLTDARIFGRALVPQLKGAVGGKAVLGRLGRGQNTKGNPPWLLKDYSEQDAAYARHYMQTHVDPRTPKTGLEGPLAQAQAQAAPPTSNVSGNWATDGGSQLPTVGVQQAPAAWQNVGAPAQAPPPPGQYQPAAHASAPVAPVAAPVAPARDPNLVALLTAKGVDVSRLPADADLSLIAANL